jgi:hypothetical protein
MFEHQAMFTLRAGDSGHWPVVDNLMEMQIHPRLPYQGDTPEPPTPPFPPVPPAGRILTIGEVASYLQTATFSGDGWTTGVCIVMAESGGKTNAIGDLNNPGPGDYSAGMWQFNTAGHPEVSLETACDPLLSSKEAFRVSAGGTEWTQWSTYNNGDYLRWWDEALTVTGGSGPTAQELKDFAYEVCLGVPEESALMREGRRLGLVPLSGEETQTQGCIIITGQVFGAGSRMVLLYCLMQDYSRVYQQEL